MYRIFTHTGKLPTTTWEYVFENTEKDCMLRKYCIGIAACFLDPAAYDELAEKEDLPFELLLGVAKLWAIEHEVDGLDGKKRVLPFDVREYYVPVCEDVWS